MDHTSQEIKNLFKKFNTNKALVIGDVMVDAYLRGKVERISPEAPVPVVALKQRETMLGGAANVAVNLHALGATVILCSVIGNDNQGDALLNLMQQAGLRTDGIVQSRERITTTKFRIIGNRMQMLRVDEEMDSDISEEETASLLGRIQNLIKSQQPDVIILQDYNKGVLTPAVIKQVISWANQGHIPVAVDPKKKNFSAYAHVTLFKPNLKEISEGLKKEVNPRSKRSLQSAANQLHKTLLAEYIMITLSEHGVFISHQDKTEIIAEKIPAIMRSIADVSGAGDTVISVASLCLANKTNRGLMASLSNLAGGLVCEKPGVVAVNKAELLAEAIKHLV